MSEEWKKKIQQTVRNNDIVVYMRGSPQAPRCGFSAKVIRILEKLGHPYVSEDMDSDPDLWQTLKNLNNWPTAPQIFVKGEFIGGCDLFVEMYQSGSLQEQLQNHS